jgi:deoxyribodipyrimidine photo-lyase
MIQPQRIRLLNRLAVRKGRYVLYWMQASQRAEWNHALEFAAGQANDLDLPLVVLFVLTDQFPEANLRHYTFMLEGLQEVHAALERRGIQFVLRRGDIEQEVMLMAAEAAAIVADRGYLRIQRTWRRNIAGHAPCRMTAVETDTVVPVEEALNREAYSAAVLRPHIKRRLPEFLVSLLETPVRRESLSLKIAGVTLRQSIKTILCPTKIDRTVNFVTRYEGGASRAKRLLAGFIGRHLADYPKLHNDPTSDCTSDMSPYLHFGQISPLYIALEIRSAEGIPQAAREAYLEELIVRRELAVNFTHYNDLYDRFESLPAWARQTLQKHAADARPYRYSADELEGGGTHDACWNAAQREMVLTGKMHNYLRMYWGKKIIEWSPSPEEAYERMIYLNNKYNLDGRDPNSFAGISWCFGKHDRPWRERNIFGTVRYMNEAGLRRKFRMDRYIEKFSG